MDGPQEQTVMYLYISDSKIYVRTLKHYIKLTRLSLVVKMEPEKQMEQIRFVGF